MHYESLARILPSRIHEISLGDGTLGASSARACHGKPCHIYHKGDYVIPFRDGVAKTSPCRTFSYNPRIHAGVYGRPREICKHLGLRTLPGIFYI